jgi:hypothetical protein
MSRGGGTYVCALSFILNVMAQEQVMHAGQGVKDPMTGGIIFSLSGKLLCHKSMTP